jgi:hypothetical protein
MDLLDKARDYVDRAYQRADARWMARWDAKHPAPSGYDLTLLIVGPPEDERAIVVVPPTLEPEEVQEIQRAYQEWRDSATGALIIAAARVERVASFTLYQAHASQEQRAS